MSGAALEKDVRKLEAAAGHLPPAVARPALVVLSGLPASGKSHLARELCRRYPLAHLEADALRKALVKHPTYSREESTRLFAASHALLGRLLARGISALLDATNLKELHRRPLYRLAEQHGARLVLVRVEASDRVSRRRLRQRARGDKPWDRSDAGPEVYEEMRAGAEPIERPHLAVDASGDIGPALDMLLRELREDSA